MRGNEEKDTKLDFYITMVAMQQKRLRAVQAEQKTLGLVELLQPEESQTTSCCRAWILLISVIDDIAR